MNDDKPFFGTEEGQPTSCGGFDDFLAVIPVDACESTLTSAGVTDPINLQYYCECENVDAPGEYRN